MGTLENLRNLFSGKTETRASRRRSQDRPDLGRRRLLYLIVGGGATATVGGATVAVVRYLMEQAKVDAQIEEYKRAESQMEPFIETFEQGFGRFIEQANELIDKANLTEAEKQGLQIPFEIFKINRENVDRNAYLLRRKSLEQTRSRTSAQAPIQNANFFFYDFLTSQAGIVASFNHLGRTIKLSSQYDPDNILDNLIAMHELIHVGQDNEDRSTIPYDEYYAFASSNELRTNGLYEATAYINEIFMLNLFTQDQFMRDVMQARGRINPQKYVTTLHARPEQVGTMVLLGEMAYQFYNSRSSLSQIDSSFLAYLNSIYRARGITPYIRTPNGYKVDPN